jgi:O-antigen biosynthesis protein
MKVVARSRYNSAQRPRFMNRLTELMVRVRQSLRINGDTLPVICIFGNGDLALTTPIEKDYEEDRLDCRCYVSDYHLDQILVRDKPHVIITTGNPASFARLMKAPPEIQRRWLHYETPPDPARLGIDAYERYLENVFCAERGTDSPLITVFTAAYRSGENILRPYKALMDQSYTNWEWIIVDDSDDRGVTFGMLTKLARKDHRIRAFKPWEHSGVIGKVKNWACSLGNGSILVELDHDDELTDYALECVAKGFQQFPQAGFLYTDCAEVLHDGTNVTYRRGWAWGYGSYTDVLYRGKLYKSANAPNINAKTIRHIISAPNHIRAWRKSFYQSIGGHNRELHVADDYELVVRTFLKTRMVRVPRLCYVQRAGNTTQQTRNRDIQRHVRSIRDHYDRMIHDRLLELECDDFVWDEKSGRSYPDVPNPAIESHATLLADI